MRVSAAKAAAVIVLLITFSCEAFGGIPITFVENRGQSYPRARFMVKGPSGSAFFTKEAVVYNLSATLDRGKGVGLWMRFVGAQTQALKGVDALPGKANFINGSDRSKWQKNVSTYRGVSYKGVWPGIDIVYKSDGTNLKYDVLVSPGADISLVRLKYEGAEKVSLNESGDLVVETASGSFTEGKPGVYQVKNGKKIWREGAFVVDGSTVGFSVKGYDRSLPLVIDPESDLVWSTFLGGSGGDTGVDGAVDANGNIYVTGTTYSVDFPVTPGAYDTTPMKEEAYVAKLDPSGTSLIYATLIGGSGIDKAMAIAVDSTGSVYLAGETMSQDFPITPGAYSTTYYAGANFILKLNPSGTSLDYSTFLAHVRIYDIAVESGNAYVTGSVTSPDFSVTSGAFQTIFGGSSDAFVTKFNQTGTGLEYSTFIGGSSFDCGYGIAVKGGAAYVTGNTYSLDFPTTPGAYDRTTTGADAFVARLDSAGSVLEFSTFLGGSVEDVGKSIAVGPDGEVFVTGYTESSDFPTTPGAYDRSFNGGRDAFVAKIADSGSSLVYSTFLGGSGNDTGKGICVDQCNSALVTGSTSSINFPVSPGAFDTSYGGGCTVGRWRLVLSGYTGR